MSRSLLIHSHRLHTSGIWNDYRRPPCYSPELKQCLTGVVKMLEDVIRDKLRKAMRFEWKTMGISDNSGSKRFIQVHSNLAFRILARAYVKR